MYISQQLGLYVLYQKIVKEFKFQEIQCCSIKLLSHVFGLNSVSCVSHFEIKASSKLRNMTECLSLLRLQNEARQLNNQEVVEEKNRLKLPSNWEAKKAQLEYQLMVDEKKKVKNTGVMNFSALYKMQHLMISLLIFPNCLLYSKINASVVFTHSLLLMCCRLL